MQSNIPHVIAFSSDRLAICIRLFPRRAVAAVLASGAYTWLLGQAMIDSDAIMNGLWTEDLSPQLEIAVASMITMSCWRGIVTRVRYR